MCGPGNRDAIKLWGESLPAKGACRWVGHREPVKTFDHFAPCAVFTSCLVQAAGGIPDPPVEAKGCKLAAKFAPFLASYQSMSACVTWPMWQQPSLHLQS